VPLIYVPPKWSSIFDEFERKNLQASILVERSVSKYKYRLILDEINFYVDENRNDSFSTGFSVMSDFF
jgi:hypothetical protein